MKYNSVIYWIGDSCANPAIAIDVRSIGQSTAPVHFDRRSQPTIRSIWIWIRTHAHTRTDQSICMLPDAQMHETAVPEAGGGGGEMDRNTVS